MAATPLGTTSNTGSPHTDATPGATPRTPPDAPAPGLLDGDRGLTRAQRSATTEALLDDAQHAGGTQRRRILDQVILINRGVAEAVASRYRRRGIANEDLDQAAYEGLVKAVLRFDPGRGKDLLSYAVPTIRGELQRHFRDHSWAVRPPRRVQDLQWRVNRCIDELTHELGHEPNEAQVCERMGLSEREYADALIAFGCFTPMSLDQPLGAEMGATVGDLVADPTSETEAAEARGMLAPALKQLPERDRKILYLRFVEDQTQDEIGHELGVTQMQVSRLLTRILRDLRLSLGVAPAA